MCITIVNEAAPLLSLFFWDELASTNPGLGDQVNSASSGSWAVGACLLIVTGGSECGMCAGQGPGHTKSLNWAPRHCSAAGEQGGCSLDFQMCPKGQLRRPHTCVH